MHSLPMAGLRVFSPHLPLQGTLTLDAPESHHLIRVRRAREGQPVEVISGNGIRAQARLVRADAKAAILEIEQAQAEDRSRWHLTLAQALPKGKTMDAVVQRATELGADRIVPLFSDQSEVELDRARAEQKRQKWSQTALESAKQCGNPWLPEISAPRPLLEFLDQTDPGTTRLVASLSDPTETVATALPPGLAPHAVCVLIGPEGDFSLSEYQKIKAAGFRSVTLGPRVLRVETAACALLAIVLERLRTLYPDG